MRMPAIRELGLSLGSNLGDRLGHLRAAREALCAYAQTTLAAQAPVYETDPVGVRPEYAHLAYLNTVLILCTDESAAPWLDRIQALEAALGRVRQADRNAPRPIDVDILYVGAQIEKTPDLTVPHPRWAERAFVLVPLADVRPDLRLPGYRQTVAQLAARLSDRATVRRFADPW
ncbi:MAG: 2-amino-4-hydroxy-6-hydroxymethyldihydropteridine diphosphokinase [Candidatus Marinimicrobia bacterium]|nr:2-amino-4-hydroxy-6-hydroxymethyldihydropteridine diphosphokinase [Candidatus Neomarinimicrobiota bacterium]